RPSGSNGREADRLVLRIAVIRRGIVWPKPAGLFIGPHIERTDVKRQRGPTHHLMGWQARANRAGAERVQASDHTELWTVLAYERGAKRSSACRLRSKPGLPPVARSARTSPTTLQNL